MKVIMPQLPKHREEFLSMVKLEKFDHALL